MVTDVNSVAPTGSCLPPWLDDIDSLLDQLRAEIRRVNQIASSVYWDPNALYADVKDERVRQSQIAVRDLIDLGVAMDIVQKQGAWYSYGAVRLGQGRENSKAFIKGNPDLIEELRQAILAAHAG